MRRLALCSVSTRALTAVAAAAAIVASATPADGQAVDSIFGFRVGEERQYLLEPGDRNLPDAPDVYAIILDSIADDPQYGRVASFRLYHAGRAVAPFPNRMSERHTIQEATELLVNEHGFPLRVQYTVEGAWWLGNGGQRATLVFRDGAYQVHNPKRWGAREHELALPTRDEIDPEKLSGVFLSGGLHPALLGLPLAVLPSGDDEIRYSALDPRPLAGDRVEDPLRDPLSNSPPSNRDNFGYDRRPFRNHTLARKDLVDVQVGSMTFRAHEIDATGLDDLWIAPDAKVLRLDTPTPRGNGWIRLKLPSEY